MEPGDVPRSAGTRLKELRLRVGLTLRDVEARSLTLAEDKKSRDYFISRGWLNNVENGSYTPSIYKLYSLSVIYRDSWTNVLGFFGLRVGDVGRDQALFGLPNTYLVQKEPLNSESVALPAHPREDLQLDRTNLLSRLIEIWGEIPVPLVQHLDLRRSLYGYIGLKDYTMYPLIRPGSFVQIDGNQRKIKSATWRTEFERPIYFIELREGYLCSWCELKDGHLSAIPYPNSPTEIRRFPYPQEAEIVGRVTGVAMRIAESSAP
jgi:transcriptional regulator with XRE-family HTH domain